MVPRSCMFSMIPRPLSACRRGEFTPRMNSASSLQPQHARCLTSDLSRRTLIVVCLNVTLLNDWAKVMPIRLELKPGARSSLLTRRSPRQNPIVLAHQHMYYSGLDVVSYLITYHQRGRPGRSACHSPDDAVALSVVYITRL